MARAPREEEAHAPAKPAARSLIALVPMLTEAGMCRPGEVVELSAVDAKLALASNMAIEVPAD